MFWHREPGRPLTGGERAMAQDMFGAAIDYDQVRIHCAKWWPFQPANYVMAPDGHIWFHPKGGVWRADFADAPLAYQAVFIHELTHVWQHQSGINLVLRRHPFCRYAYALTPGKPFARYGIEQQAMIVEHAFRVRREGAAPEVLARYEDLVRFA